MSLMVTGIRLPFDLPEQAAIAEARRLTGLTANDIQAAVCRVSIDARRGQISRVYSVRLDAPFDEKAFAEKLQICRHGTGRGEKEYKVCYIWNGNFFEIYGVSQSCAK